MNECKEKADLNVLAYIAHKGKTIQCSVEGCLTDPRAHCDFDLGHRTCDRLLCDRHKVSEGDPARDFCPEHARTSNT